MPRRRALFSVSGVSVTPHTGVPTLKYARPQPPAVGALVRVFVRTNAPIARHEFLIDNELASVKLARGAWTWCDFLPDDPLSQQPLPAGSLTVLTFNTSQLISKTLEIFARGGSVPVSLQPSDVVLASATFLGKSVHPDKLILHARNVSSAPIRIERVRFHSPIDPARPDALVGGGWFTKFQRFGARIGPNDFGLLEVETGRLPLSFAAIEVEISRPNAPKSLVWAYCRVKRETFDISGGWIGDGVRDETTLKVYQRLFVNTMQGGKVDGYSGTSLEAKYPIKSFHACQPLAEYDRDEMLPKIHAVEFLGEPQYGGGKPVAPQDVFKQLRPYAPTRLATTVTLSDAGSWHRYAGLSDFVHYDAYRVCAPAADAWHLYDWPDGKRIFWGAPLESIADMCVSLREMARPSPTAAWAQGAHHGWDGRGRRRRSPTPDELRLQAYHALATRITSLYWFNLSPKSLAAFPDLLPAIEAIGREIQALKDIYLAGCATFFARGTDDWDRHVISSAIGCVGFALDRKYAPDPTERVFAFEPDRASTFFFPLPAYARKPFDVFRFDARGVSIVKWRVLPDGIEVSDTISRVGIYVILPRGGKKSRTNFEENGRT